MCIDTTTITAFTLHIRYDRDAHHRSCFFCYCCCFICSTQANHTISNKLNVSKFNCIKLINTYTITILSYDHNINFEQEIANRHLSTPFEECGILLFAKHCAQRDACYNISCLMYFRRLTAARLTFDGHQCKFFL